MDTFFYLGKLEQEIEGKKWIKILVFSNSKLVIVPIYKLYSNDLKGRLDKLKQFDNISSLVTFAIKSNGKVTLDIK